jgi:thiamine pyrophosphate-dependent acetolactate synthase large subunit-like protein
MTRAVSGFFALAMRSAFHEHIPMVIVAPDTLTPGAVPSLDPGPEWPTLLVDLAGPVRNAETVTKWAKEVKTGSDLAADVRRAWYFAESVPRGPTLPFDILMSQVAPRWRARASPLVAPSTACASGRPADKPRAADRHRACRAHRRISDVGGDAGVSAHHCSIGCRFT